MKYRLVCMGLGGLLAVSGCASLSESQCLASDWQTIGYRDGAAGLDSSALLRHQDACVPHGVMPRRIDYLAGWNQGVTQYCQPGNGFSLGESGAGYANVCPAALQPTFFAAYRDGRRLHAARSEIQELHRSLERREGRLQEIRDEFTHITAALLDAQSTTADRAAMLLGARDLAAEQERLEHEVEALESELAVKRVRFEALRQDLALAAR